MPEEQNKGQDFVSQRNLKNQLFGKKNEDIGALNRTMSSFSTRNIKALDSLTKQITNLNKNIVSMAKPSQQKKDFVRREDPMKKFIKEIDDLEELTKKQLKLEKDKKKGKGLLGFLGIIGGLGTALAGAGIIGYLLTGKKELLNNVYKSVVKYLPTRLFFNIFDKGLKWVGKKSIQLFKPVLGWIGKGIGWVGKKIGNLKVVKKIGEKISGVFIQPLKNFGKKISGNILKKSSKFLKPMTNILKKFTKLTKPLLGIFGKGGGKSLGKTAAKIAGKVGLKALKNVPVIGTIIGTFFGIQRWKKGDKAGALMEIASGLLSNIPFAGLAVDAFLIVRDLIGPKKVDSFVGGVVKKVGKKVGPAILRNIPVVGTVLRFMDGMKLWKSGSKIDAIKKFGGALASLVPGAGWVFDTVLAVADKLKVGKKLKDAGKSAGEFLGKAADKPIKATTELVTGGVKATGRALKRGTGAILSAPGKLWGFAKRKAKGAASGLVGATNRMMYENERPEKDSRKRGVESIAGERGVGWYTYKPWSPRIRELDEGMWNNFTGMAKEYFSETGDLIQINSAYRRGSGSVHNAGFAIDINSSNANALERMGLMKKWGFHRPLLNWEKKKETWHVEPYPGGDYGPRNTNNYPIRKAVAQGKTDFGGGGLNMPRSQIAGKVNSNQKEKLELSDSTIQALANAMGSSFKGAIPRQSRDALGVTAEMRG